VHFWPGSGVKPTAFYLAQRAAERAYRLHPVRRAKAAKGKHVARLLRALPPSKRHFAALYLLLFVSSSRFGDVKSEGAAAKDKKRAYLLDFPAAKVPTKKWVTKKPFESLALDLPKLWEKIRGISYGQARSTLQRLNRSLSLHSFRRGSATALAQTKPLSQVATLTGHKTQRTRDEATVAQYIAPTPFTHQAREQQELSEILWKKVKRHLPM